MYIKPAFLSLLTILLFAQVGLAQSKKIKNVWAFAKEMSYGRELRGLDGQPIERRDTSFFLYLEVKGKSKPKLNDLSFNGKTYAPSVYPVTEKVVVAGIQKATNKKMTVRRSSAGSLWRVELNPLEGHGTKTTLPKMIFLRGTLDGRTFSLPIKKFIQLEADIMG